MDHLSDLLEELVPRALRTFKLAFNDGYGSFLLAMFALGVGCALGQIAFQTPVEEAEILRSLLTRPNEPWRSDERVTLTTFLSLDAAQDVTDPRWTSFSTVRELAERLVQQPGAPQASLVLADRLAAPLHTHLEVAHRLSPDQALPSPPVTQELNAAWGRS